MTCTGQNVIRILRLLEDGGVPAWLDGGWGIDALLRKETRAHRDLDLIVPLENLTTAEAVLAQAGFAKDECRTNMPTRLVLRNRDGLQIDIHPVIFRPDGSAVHIDADEGGLKYPYIISSGGLSGTGIIDGRVVRCTSAAEQIRQRVERRYSPWAERRMRERGVSADVEDICILLEVFGVDGDEPAQAAKRLEARAAGNLVVDAAQHFCLRHVSELNAQHSRLTSQHAELIAQYAQLKAQFNAIRASTSWRLTAPMRSATQWLRTHRHKLEKATHGSSAARANRFKSTYGRGLKAAISEPSSSAPRALSFSGRNGA